MAMARAAYDEIRDVVGAENLSCDEAVLDSYACHATFVGVPTQGMTKSNWWMRSGAVALPATTAQVQELVRICNRHGIRFRAHSTGQVPTAFPWGEDTLIIELRRMDRIIDINEEHMYALVEPYVTQGELFVECIKRGLAPHMIDAGASISPLASVTSVHGEGDSGITRSYNERNAMAVEWVLPNGDILRPGTPDFPGGHWFSGDGPGPSLLGIMRGTIGHMGEMGVFTKAAIKLYPWHGPSVLESGGAAPFFDLKLWPLSDLIILKWDDYRREADALYLIGEAEIFESFGRLSTTKTEAVVAWSKSEWVAIRESDLFGRLYPKGGWFGLIVSRSREHFDYCHQTVARILEETGGTLFRPRDIEAPAGVESPETWGERVTSALLQMVILKNLTLKACEMPMAGTIGPMPAMSTTSIDKTMEMMEVMAPIKRRYAAEGKILDDGPDGCWCTIDEGGHWMKQMNFTRVERMDPKAVSGLMDSVGPVLRAGLPLTDVIPNFDVVETQMPYTTRIADMLDPAEVSKGFWRNLYGELFSEE